jgi:3-hydroxyacyl-CoA dehydrogenase
VFTKLDRICRPGAILATNTSSLDIDEIASATGRPSQASGSN